MTCRVDNCQRPVKVEKCGLCGMHYQRFKKWGDPLVGGRPSAEDRLLSHGIRDSETGCLRWDGFHLPKGYAKTRVGGKEFYVHRLAYMLWVGPIPDGYDVDHVWKKGCRHRDCFEPTHLEAVTRPENLARSRAKKVHAINPIGES